MALSCARTVALTTCFKLSISAYIPAPSRKHLIFSPFSHLYHHRRSRRHQSALSQLINRRQLFGGRMNKSLTGPLCFSVK